MLRIRPEIASIRPYVPGRHLDDVAREIGVNPGEIIKLASNESPEGPFPGVAEAVAKAIPNSNRYPDNDVYDLRGALAETSNVPRDCLWFGCGSTSLISHVAMALGGSGTSAVYAWPSFVMYRIASRWALTESIEVPLTDVHVHDLDAMSDAIRDDTTVVYVCNPNNPTGTVVSAQSLNGFIESIPPDVLVVVDEAYHDFVADPAYESAIPQALQRPNVLVLRTFSKIYSLAAHRIGFGVSLPGTISELIKAQPPFSVGRLAQVAAAASLGQPEEVRRRTEANAAGRRHLLGVLAERGVAHSETQTNFVYCQLGDDSAAMARAFTARGVIIRPMSGGWIRVTIGTDAENRRFVTALDSVLSSL